MILVVSARNQVRLNFKRETKYYSQIFMRLCVRARMRFICVSVFCECIFVYERTAIS